MITFLNLENKLMNNPLDCFGRRVLNERKNFEGNRGIEERS